MPPHARAGQIGRGHRFAAYPRCWADQVSGFGSAMKMTDGYRCMASLALALWGGGGCSHHGEPDCIPPPCPVPIAIMVRVTSSTGGPVPNLVLTLSGPAIGSASCSVDASANSCSVLGDPGIYNLRLTAPGFEEKMLSLTVQGSPAPPCGCSSVQRQDVDVVLSPS
jgi:hypothetical protein